MSEIPFFIVEHRKKNPDWYEESAIARAAEERPRQRIGIVKEAGTLKVTSRPITKMSMVVRAMYEILDELTQEAYYVISLDDGKRIIGIHMVSMGTLTVSIVHPRDVFKVPLALGAKYVISVHNHPSGNPTPSPQDRSLAERMDRAADILGMSFLDHLTIGQGTDQYYSMRMERMGFIGEPK